MLKRMAKIYPMAKYAIMAVGIMLVTAGVEFIFRRALENAQPEQAFTYSFIVSVVYSFLIVFIIAIVWMAAQEFSAKKDGGPTVQLSDILEQKAESGGLVIGPIPLGASEDTQAALSKLFAANNIDVSSQIPQKSNVADVDAEISKVLNQYAENAYFRNDHISRPGWDEGYLVQVEDIWYYTDVIRTQTLSALPTFIRTRKDAEAFIAEANDWFVEGSKIGKQEAKDELRRWFS